MDGKTSRTILSCIIENFLVPILICSNDLRLNSFVPMHRKQFLLSMGAGMLSLLPHRVSSTSLTGRKDRAPGGSIPRKAIIPAAITSIDEEGQIDFEDFKRHIRTLADTQGVSAIMVNGGSMHDKTLSREERQKLLAEALKAVDGSVPILAAVRESKAMSNLTPLAKDAQQEGAQAITIMPPGRAQGYGWEAARRRFEEVCAVADLPVVIYQTRYDTEVLVQLASTFPVVGVKEGSKDPLTFEQNLRALRGLQRNIAVWSTHSKWLLADLAIGADGILSGMGSVAADLQAALAEAVSRSDLAAARRINDRIFPLVEAFYYPEQDAHISMKYALKKLGRQKHDFVRPPLRPLTAADRSRIDRALVVSGLL